jgi:hypothetical protein
MNANKVGATVVVNPVTYKDIEAKDSAKFLQQHHFFTGGLFASHYFPLDSEAQFESIHRFAANALAGQGVMDWTTVGRPGNLQVSNALRAAILAAVLAGEYAGQETISAILSDAFEFVIALFLGSVQTQLATGNYGSTPAQNFAQVQIWQQQANT